MWNRTLRALAAVLFAAVFAVQHAQSQVNTFNREQLVKYTAKSTFERFPDGRPKVPDALLERLKKLTTEEVHESLPRNGYRNQFEEGWQILRPERILVGRAFTLQYMPSRPDVTETDQAEAKARGERPPRNQTAIDMLQPNDVIVVDMFGSKNPFAGNKLAYYIMKATGAGMVVDGNVYWTHRIADMDISVYTRHTTPGSPGTPVRTGVNVPIRVDNTTVMPGDVVFGDREGVTFIPPHLVEEVVKTGEYTLIRDEWFLRKFDTGKYKSTEIYGVTDPELIKERDEFIKQRLNKPPQKQQ
jgi:4-hydroxy-4-methyl-2-oxoglutarate aldolase